MSKLDKILDVDLRKFWELETRNSSAWSGKLNYITLQSEQIVIEFELLKTYLSEGRVRIDVFNEEAIVGNLEASQELVSNLEKYYTK